MRNAFGLRAAAERGQQAAWAAGTSGASSAASGSAAGDASPPAWAQKLHATQTSRHRRQMAIHAIQSRSEEHTPELQSLMRHSYAVFCLKKQQNVPSPHR